MAVAATDDNIIITLPRLLGYKTLVLNSVAILFSVVSVLYPKFVTPDPQALDILFSQGAAAVVAVFGVINILLRLISTGPAGPFIAPKSDDDRGEVKAVVLASGKVDTVLQTRPQGAGAMPAATLHELAMHLGVTDVSRGAHASWPLVDGVEHDDQCALRAGSTCSCFAHYPTRTQVEPDASLADALSTDRFANPVDDDAWRGLARKAMPSRKYSSMAHAFVAALLFPSFLLFAGLAVATMPGCASVQQISAVAQAETVEQRAFAAYGTFVVMEERAADIIADRRIPKAIRQRIQAVDRVAKPAADVVLDLARQLNAVRTGLGASQSGSSADRVALASQRLLQALASFGPKLTALVQAVEGVRG
jgi:hypothetical protein